MCRTHQLRTSTRAISRGRPPLTYYVATGAVALVVLTFALPASADNRTIDGTMNNLANPDWGAATDPGAGRYVQLRRVAPSDYGDGISTPAGASRPSAREVSNAVVAQSGSVLNARYLSDFVWQWGQFLDHDIDLTEAAEPHEPFDIPVPTGDPYFDPMSTGTQTIPLNRSAYDPNTGLGPGNPREQVNQITSYIDASNVYGSDPVRAAALRTNGGTGAKLLTSGGGDLLPLNTALLPNANGGPFPDDQLFLAGDVRANEQVGLTAMHTLFVREHNRLVDELSAANPTWTDEQLYQRARKIVGAQMQAITYEEFLPALLGPYAPSSSGTYDANVDATIINEFSTAMYRLGHSMLSPQLLRLQGDGTPAPGGPLALKDAFFDPTLLQTGSDVDEFLKGLASQRQQETDTMIVDDLRNFLFGPPGSGGFDLASLNIQRGRDHGLPDYNTLRVAYGLTAVADFSDITSDTTLQMALQALYGDVNDIDPWIGALAEDHLPGASVGELIARVLQEQFERLRDGDRFWYENDPDFTAVEIEAIRSTRLSDIIRRNTGITSLQNNVFVVPEPASVVLYAISMLAIGFGRSWRRRRGARRTHMA